MMITRPSVINYQRTDKGKASVKRAINKYRNSEKGKLAYQKAQDRLKKTNPTYAKTYMANKREEAKENGFCPQCFKVPPLDHRKLCMECAIKINGKTIYTTKEFN